MPEQWIVIIEWDGNKPPGAYYQRIKNLTSRVRYEKDKSVIARRAEHDERGIFLQEGALLCGSESLARTVAMVASIYGAKYVQVGRVSLLDTEQQTLNHDDAEALAKIQQAFGQRGPKQAEQDFSVTCFEECKVFYVPAASQVINCPHCGSFLIRTRPGQARNFANPIGKLTKDMLQGWAMTRFAEGLFEIPLENLPMEKVDGAVLPPKNYTLFNDKEKQVFDLMKNSDLSFVDGMTFGNAAQILDAIFASRLAISPDTRRRQRVATVMELVQRGIDIGHMSLTEPQDHVDPIDAACIMGVVVAAGMWIKSTYAAKVGQV